MPSASVNKFFENIRTPGLIAMSINIIVVLIVAIIYSSIKLNNSEKAAESSRTTGIVFQSLLVALSLLMIVPCFIFYKCNIVPVSIAFGLISLLGILNFANYGDPENKQNWIPILTIVVNSIILSVVVILATLYIIAMHVDETHFSEGWKEPKIVKLKQTRVYRA